MEPQDVYLPAACVCVWCWIHGKTGTDGSRVICWLLNLSVSCAGCVCSRVSVCFVLVSVCVPYHRLVLTCRCGFALRSYALFSSRQGRFWSSSSHESAWNASESDRNPWWQTVSVFAVACMFECCLNCPMDQLLYLGKIVSGKNYWLNALYFPFYPFLSSRTFFFLSVFLMFDLLSFSFFFLFSLWP